jgi:hypothetical protein
MSGTERKEVGERIEQATEYVLTRPGRDAAGVGKASQERIPSEFAS